MTDKQIIIDGVNVSECECMMEDYQQANNLKGGYEHIKNVCELGERGSEYYNLFCKDNPNCNYKQLKRKEKACKEWKEEYRAKVEELNELEEKLLRKEQEYEDLRQYHNKCCEENAKKLEEWLERYNQVSRDFYNGKYCNKENCSLLEAKHQECEELKHKVELMMDCASCKIDEYKQTLTEIKDIAEEDFNHTCWETYARQLKQILQKISECEVQND